MHAFPRCFHRMGTTRLQDSRHNAGKAAESFQTHYIVSQQRVRCHVAGTVERAWHICYDL